MAITAIELAGKVILRADKIITAIDEVKSFNETAEQLLERVNDLKPAVEMLSGMQGQENKKLMSNYEKKNTEMAAFSKLLHKILKVFEDIVEYKDKLSNKGTVGRMWKKDKITKQFLAFDKRLSECIGSIQFNVLVSMRKDRDSGKTETKSVENLYQYVQLWKSHKTTEVPPDRQSSSSGKYEILH